MHPLAGIKVIDLSRVLAGPYCAAMLADLGAEVTKIEIPERGDDARHFAPFIDGQSSYFMQVNRGKKSVTLDLKSDEGLELLRKLVAGADVLVENFRPGVTERLGIDHAAMAAINPGLVYVSISGFGQDGPLARRPAYDHIIQAMGGIMATTGWPDGMPTRVGDSVADCVAGIYGAFGALAALIERAKTGKGRHVDVAMLDTMLSLQMVSLSQVVAGNDVPPRVGNAHSGSAPMDAFAASDGHVVIAVANNALFARLAETLGQPDLARDPRYLTDPLRIRNKDTLGPVISAWTQTRSVDEIVAVMEGAGIPVAPIWTLKQAIESGHARDHQLLRKTETASGAPLRVMPLPLRFDGNGVRRDFTPPALGADTDDLLRRELGLTDTQIAGLRDRGVI